MANNSSSFPSGSAAGIALSQQVADETDEERRKRLLLQQQQRLLPGTSPAGAALGQFNSGYSAALGSY